MIGITLKQDTVRGFLNEKLNSYDFGYNDDDGLVGFDVYTEGTTDGMEVEKIKNILLEDGSVMFECTVLGSKHFKEIEFILPNKEITAFLSSNLEGKKRCAARVVVEAIVDMKPKRMPYLRLEDHATTINHQLVEVTKVILYPETIFFIAK